MRLCREASQDLTVTVCWVGYPSWKFPVMTQRSGTTEDLRSRVLTQLSVSKPVVLHRILLQRLFMLSSGCCNGCAPGIRNVVFSETITKRAET